MDTDTTKGDLAIQNARLLDGRVVTILVEQGRYRAITEEPVTDLPERTIDADGGLVTESFVNGHMHLDKVYTLPMVGDGAIETYTGGGMGSAMRSIVDDASKVKDHYDRSWIVPNVRRALDEAIRNGVLHIQAFVDVDTKARLEGMAAVLQVREEYRDLVDLQVVAFPQDGLLRDEGAAELCEQAIRDGADVVGGIPWIESSDRDAAAHIEWACSLAAKTGRRVAMLVDDAGDPTLRTTGMLAESMIDHGLHGRGVACHARALGLYPAPSVLRLIDLSRRADLGFVSDPHTGPLALPVRQFLADDMPVALGQDDIEDAYYPFGRHNMLEVAFLAAHLLEFRSGPDQLRLIDMITRRAASVLGLADHAIAVGNAANLCVHSAKRVVDLLARHDMPRAVVRSGRIIAESSISSEIHR